VAILHEEEERLKVQRAMPVTSDPCVPPDWYDAAGDAGISKLIPLEVRRGEKTEMRKVDVTGPIYAVAFSPDGRILASAGQGPKPRRKKTKAFTNLA